ncbi:Mitochondrial Carrier (MC) protein [Phytophthora megakarya]|uniref:Mitochondrial Carrier (MC) protein n=1 Tax=Phytophthora megakarya TaxID=4795 RepID=A0A225VEJ6_9STRA|nr:Mitochondrial Carrier (MC) protein [Phytophthora megakarya]
MRLIEKQQYGVRDGSTQVSGPARPTCSQGISVYEKSCKVFKAHSTIGDKGANFAGGAVAPQQVVVTLDIVSQRMLLIGQGQDVRKTREHPEVSSQVYRTEGLVASYTGFVPSIATYTPSSSLVGRGLLYVTEVVLTVAVVVVKWGFSGASAGIMTGSLTNTVGVV